MASRKPKYNHNRIYKITYRDGSSAFDENVAALDMPDAIALFREAVGFHTIYKIERTDITTYYGVNR